MEAKGEPFGYSGSLIPEGRGRRASTYNNPLPPNPLLVTVYVDPIFLPSKHFLLKRFGPNLKNKTRNVILVF